LHPVRQRLTLKMSMDGPENIHDGIRGYPGAFKALNATLALCQAEAFTVELTATLMRENISILPEILDQAMALPCRKLNLVELIPVGRATTENCLEPEERRRATEIIRKYRCKFAKAGRILAWRLPFIKGGLNLICGGGISECGITTDGNVVGCRLLPQYSAGNIKKRPFSEIWKSGEFGFFREEAPYKPGEDCWACLRRAKCRGGCRAYALGITNQIAAKDPRCLK
jgi:radical SAM protein with 4Fe4S-binding SPASM domain